MYSPCVVTWLMISIIFGVCISDLVAYKELRPIRGPVVKRIPIRPLDYSTIKRISRKHVPLNPDSESIFLPVNAAQFKPYQVMERISLAPPHPNHIRNRLNHHNLKKNDNFNILNSDAYLMKPKDDMVIVNTDPNRGSQFANRTDNYYEDARPSSSAHHKYRSKTVPKKPKKTSKRLPMIPVRDTDDFELYKTILEQQNREQAATMKKNYKKHVNHFNVNPVKHAQSGAELPIGIDYSEQKSINKLPYPPITYAPIYLNNLHRSHHHEDVEASNIYVRTQPLEMLQNEQMPPTTIPSVSSTFAVPIEFEQTKHTMAPIEVHQSEEAKSYHKVANAPEMYKFTVDDAVIRPIIQNLHPFNGPVTLLPEPVDYSNQPDEHYAQSDNVPLLNMNNGIENIPASIRPVVRGRHPMNHHHSHHQTQINYPPSEYARTGYRRLEPSQYSQQYHSNHNSNYESNPINPNVNHMIMEVSASSRRQSQKVSSHPILMTTQMTVTTENNNSDTDQPVETTMAIESVRRQKKRRRPINSNRHPIEQSEPNKSTRKSTHHKDSNNNNLEVSSSYTKRRTQGYNSEEDDGTTTPISPIKLKSAKNPMTSESKLVTSTAPPQRLHALNSPRIQKSKYFS